MAQRTRDGIRINDLVSTLESIPGIRLRSGTRHTYIARMEGFARPCPLASSTHVRRMVVPWLREVAGITDSRGIYSCLRTGQAYSQ